MLHHNLEYGDSKCGQLEDWLVNFFYMQTIKKIKKETYVEIHKDLQNMFNFYDSFYGVGVKGLYWSSLWWHPEKTVKVECTRRVSKLDSWYYFNGSIFVSFIIKLKFIILTWKFCEYILL